MTALALVTHSRIYAGQFLSSAPFDSLSARSFTASRSTRRTSLRSMATTLLSCSSKLRRRSTSFPVICPLMCNVRRPGAITTRSILQVIVLDECNLQTKCKLMKMRYLFARGIGGFPPIGGSPYKMLLTHADLISSVGIWRIALSLVTHSWINRAVPELSSWSGGNSLLPTLVVMGRAALTVFTFRAGTHCRTDSVCTQPHMESCADYIGAVGNLSRASKWVLLKRGSAPKGDED